MSDHITINGERYQLTFYDEFEGESLDLNKWNLAPEWQRQDVGGYWNDSMTEVKNGKLILRAALDINGVPISGAIRSKGLFEQAFGYFEAKIKWHKTTGFWGAFWMMCGNVTQVDGSAESGVEIDIIESGERVRGAVNHALHWDGYGMSHKQIAEIISTPDQYDGDFHTYGLLWNEDGYTFFIDGAQTFHTAACGVCREKGYLKLTTEFGKWAAPIVPSELPDCIEVDYVRVYQKTSSESVSAK